MTPLNQYPITGLVPTEADILAKLNATAAAQPWSATSAYDANTWVTYNGGLFRAKVAIAAPESGSANTDPATDGGTNWEAKNMTSPDATFDITAAGLARIVGRDGTLLWQQGRSIVTPQEIHLSSPVNDISYEVRPVDGAINTYAASSLDDRGITLPTVMPGKAGDFVLHIDYYIGSACNFQVLGLDNTVCVVVPEGETLAGILQGRDNTLTELHFEQTGWTSSTAAGFATAGLPVWKVTRTDWENGGATT